MTNKERLEANNAKIEAIQKTLNNKILALGEKGKAIELPDEFNNTTSMSYFVLNDDVVLFSCNPISTMGFWVHRISTSTWEKFTPNINTNYFAHYVKVSDTKCIMSTYSDSFGLWLYDATTNELTKIYSTGSYYSFGSKIGDKVLLSAIYKQGILLYDSTNNSVKQIYDVGTHWRYGLQVAEDKLLISSESKAGLMLYNSTLETITQVYDSYTKWDTMLKINDHKFLLGKTGGVWLFNSNTDTLTNLYAVGDYWIYSISVGNGKWLLGSKSSTNSRGVLLYNDNTDEVVLLYDGVYGWTNFIKLTDNKYLIGNSVANTSALRYDSTDDSVIAITGTGGWSEFLPIIDTKCLISSHIANYPGADIYDALTDTAIGTGVKGYLYDKLTVEGSNYYAESSDKTKNKFIIQCFPETNTAKIAKYYVEGV